MSKREIKELYQLERLAVSHVYNDTETIKFKAIDNQIMIRISVKYCISSIVLL